MILSSSHGMQTDHAEPIDLLSLTEEGVIMVLDRLFRWNDQCSEENYRTSEDNSLSDVYPSYFDIDDCQVQHQHDDRNTVVKYRLKVRSSFRLVPHLSIADKLQIIQKRIPVIQHFPDLIKLIHPCNFKRSLPLGILPPPIRACNQQLLNYFTIAVCYTDMQRRMPIQILLIDQYLFLSEEVLYYLFAAAVTCPMQRGAPLQVLGVYIELSLMQEQHGVYLIPLGCEMQQVHAQVTDNRQIRLVLLE